MNYFVIDSASGQKYGPADIETLNRWIAEGRVTPQTTLEDATSGAQIGASAVAGLNFGNIAPPPTTPSAPPAEPTGASSYSPPSGSFQTPPSPYPRGGTSGADQSGKITGSYICSIIGIFCCPIVLCSIGIMLANQAKKEGDPRGQTASTVGIVCLVAGVVIGVLSYSGGWMTRMR